MLSGGGQRFTGNQLACVIDFLEGMPSEVQVTPGHDVTKQWHILYYISQIHPAPILHINLTQLPSQAPPLDITHLIPGTLADAPGSNLQCLHIGEHCNKQLLHPVNLMPQPGNEQVVNLIQFDVGHGAGGVSVYVYRIPKLARSASQCTSSKMGPFSLFVCMFVLCNYFTIS